jgi:hypothetical protein
VWPLTCARLTGFCGGAQGIHHRKPGQLGALAFPTRWLHVFAIDLIADGAITAWPARLFYTKSGWQTTAGAQ